MTRTYPCVHHLRTQRRRPRRRKVGHPALVRTSQVEWLPHSVVRSPPPSISSRKHAVNHAKPVVLIAEELSPATIEALGPDFEVRSCNGADRAELLTAIVDVDAILVRSATKVDAEALAAATRLKVVARAGVGLDNVDVKAATQAGVMVVNAPTSNIVSAAELAVALMLAAARHISPAHAALRNGEWKRSKYTGIELYEKTVGIVGLGRIGVLVAQRLSAFGMKVIAYDPYVQAGRAAQMGVRLVDLDTLLAESDFMSVHLPKTPETVGLIGADQLAAAKPSLVLVNAARGGIVDEAALFDALKTGQIAAAGLDVFASEPCTDSPLFELDNVVATPHLGASTDEAQEKAGVSVARSVRLALSGELVPDAVNVQGGVIAEDVRPGIPLTEKLGRVFTALAGEVAQQLDVEVRGEITEYDVKVLELAALKGVFADVVEEQVSYVNAPLLAAERGTEVRLVTDSESPDHRNLITLRGTLADGTQVSVSGTLVGLAQKERLVEVNGFDVDIEPTTHLAFFTYEDRPGMVGTIGGILGDANVNIAGMQVSRQDRGGAALVALSVDSAIPADTLAQIETAMQAVSVRAVDLS
ncbi:phosphoglycerate dehydrogenase [Nocardioides zhouii]|uniref:D-3-phosphoglycerate dehydrogenase n=1 Tax=Nocardioides zhouii TaxID=1168729 RepID=A0A4Q2T4P1_9ACTN|nr:phosphoglycerate dehydrogenase [Nocardioides zhouii]